MSQRDYFEKDYYAVLGVPKDATAAEVSKAYRKLARELHPDARPDDPAAEARFKEVSEAYSVLSNADKRREYDQVREMVGSGGFFGPGGAGPGGFGFPGGAGGAGFGGQTTFDLNDLLGGLFGQTAGAGTRRGTAARRGRDVETDVTLSFADAMAGVTTTLRVTGPAPCATCMGSGAKPGTSPIACPTCGGNGVIASNEGLFGFSEPCRACRGTGRQIPDPCPTCRGSGSQTRAREIRARIPAGVRDGARVRLKGKGEPGRGGAPAGDLFVVVHVDEHPLFERRGDHLGLRVPVTFAEAALGAKVSVPTLEGTPVTVKIPPGTQPGTTLRVRGHGVPLAGSRRGDLLVTVDVVVPRRMSRDQRKAVEALGAFDDGSVREHFDAYLGEAVVP